MAEPRILQVGNGGTIWVDPGRPLVIDQAQVELPTVMIQGGHVVALADTNVTIRRLQKESAADEGGR